MNYILVRCTDILMFIVSILVEDINWLRGYLTTLTNTECVLFFIILIVFTLLMKYLIDFAKFVVEIGVTCLKKKKPGFISTNLEQNVKLNNLDYCRGYDEGYDKGYEVGKAEREREEAKKRREEAKKRREEAKKRREEAEKRRQKELEEARRQGRLDAARSAAKQEADKSFWDKVGEAWDKLWS